jgi:hypothetical protein
MLRDKEFLQSLSRGALRIGVAMSLAIGARTAAHADQTRLYEWRDASGITTYSQVPPTKGTPGATIREFDTRNFTSAQKLAVQSYLHGLDAAELADSKRFRQQVDAADRKVNEAMRQLVNAERVMRLGRIPMSGERVSNAGGGSRLRTDYFERQKRLEDAVQASRADLAEAYAVRDAIHP